MRLALALIVCSVSSVQAAPCVTCRPQAVIVRQPYIAAAKQAYIQYAAPPVNYYVAPWVQAQAQDAYHFRGSEERLELERLRGYVAAVQELTRREVTDEPAEPQPGFDEPPQQQVQPQAQLPPPVPAATRPLVQMYCAKCHNEEKQSGNQWIDANAPMDGSDYDAKRGLIWRVLNEGKMPQGPDGEPHALPAQTIHDIMRELSGAPEAEAPAQPPIPQQSVEDSPVLQKWLKEEGFVDGKWQPPSELDERIRVTMRTHPGMDYELAKANVMAAMAKER